MGLLTVAGCTTNDKSLSSASTLAPLTPATTVPVATVLATTLLTTVPATTDLATTVPVITVGPTIEATTIPPQTIPPQTGPPETISPATTVPDAAATAATNTTAIAQPPVTTPPAVGCVACKPDYTFAYASFFDVPQLGTEPVRGTGCGADGSLGETIPNGIWDGHITVSKSSLKIDVQCIYYGASAAPFVAACEKDHSADECLQNGDDFWMVNNNPRKRIVPLDAGFRHRYASADGCADPGPGKGASKAGPEQDSFDSWIVIENGKATFALTSCIYG